MRLVCPSCEAKYEVPEDAIPDTGRDVQCANCGHAWFQMRSRFAPGTGDEVAATAPVVAPVGDPAAPTEAAVAVQDAVTETAVADSEPAPEAAPVTIDAAPAPDPIVELAADTLTEVLPEMPEPPVSVPDVADLETLELDAVNSGVAADAETAEAALEMMVGESVEAWIDADPQSVAASTPAPEVDPDASDDPQSTAPLAVGAAAYAVDESVLAILREEAEREVQARRTDARPLESQTDLGLDAATPGRQKPALIPADAALHDGDADAGLKPSARRDLLPDVEEINSTLRPSEIEVSADGWQSVTPQGESRGFRSGFLLVMTAAIIGAVVYIAAPRLVTMVPSLADPLAGYVSAVDGLRLSLDGMMRSATVAINGE